MTALTAFDPRTAIACLGGLIAVALLFILILALVAAAADGDRQLGIKE